MRKILFLFFPALFALNCSNDDDMPCASCSDHWQYQQQTPSSSLCGSYNASTQYCSNGTVKTYGTVSDGAGRSYKTVVIGGQTWMAENLNYNVSGSVCYNGQDNYCAQYGRLYNWATAMNISSDYNSSSYNPSPSTKYRGICPQNWHIPNDDEWSALFNAVGGSSVAGRKLKSQSGWYNCGPSGSGNSYVCEDAFGFSALPGGNGGSYGGFDGVGYSGYWWSASEYSSYLAYSRYMDYYLEYAGYLNYDKSYLFSVRCLQDYAY